MASLAEQQQLIETPISALEDLSSSLSNHSEESDPSYDLVQDINLKGSCKRRPGENHDIFKRYRGKHGQKYAKISNESRSRLIEQVTTTGCTIKSAAKELNINFSTAKAIMQIYRKEGRTTKKISRKNKPIHVSHKDSKQGASQNPPQEESQEKLKVEADQNNLETNLYQQAEEMNRNQSLIIQQINAQNYYLQERINQLSQEKIQLSQKYSYLTMQYSQLQSVVNFSIIIRCNNFCHKIIFDYLFDLFFPNYNNDINKQILK